MQLTRIATLVAVATLLVACAPEPTASALTAKSIANLKTARAVHLDGGGSLAINAQQGVSFSLDFKVAGDAELPDKARMTVNITTFGMSFSFETITIGGKEYTKDATSGRWSEGTGRAPINTVVDPLGNIDASSMHDVVDVDRPEVDGKKTRHLRYTADTTRMLTDMKKTAGSSAQSFSNPQGTGDIWIRIDDAQIVRQLVKVTLDVDGLAGLDLGPGAAAVGKASIEMSLDMGFSHHGGAVPQVTAPPLGR